MVEVKVIHILIKNLAMSISSSSYIKNCTFIDNNASYGGFNLYFYL